MPRQCPVVKKGSVWAFNSPLDFPEDDKLEFPWIDRDRRHYVVEADKALGAGGFAVAFKALPCEADGTPIPGAKSIVLKFPNVGSLDRFTETERSLRKHYTERKAFSEWGHVRRRLLGCKFANPIIDFADQWYRLPEDLGESSKATVTCQPCLEDYLPLENWLIERGFRSAHRTLTDGSIDDTWHGISDGQRWQEVARLLSEAVTSVHERRVIHGDLWPPNIFVQKKNEDPQVKLIDFGESNLFLPIGTGLDQKDHPYRAPERGRKSTSVPTELIDVYSFGKLMLWLATGRAIRLSDDLRGHDRRQVIRKEIMKRNANLLRYHPEVLDIIATCLAYDPVDRPRMNSIREDLRNRPTDIGEQRTARLKSLAGITNFFEESKPSPDFAVLHKLLDAKIREVERLTRSLSSDMIDLEGHRDFLIQVLVSLVDDLHANDSWTTITTPDVWQGQTLGLDGRYRTAMIHALRRKARISRGYLFSVEELGTDWCTEFVSNLRVSGSLAGGLADAVEKQVAEFQSVRSKTKYQAPPESHRDRYRKQFEKVLVSLESMVQVWELKDRVLTAPFTKIRDGEGTKSIPGFYLGLVPLCSCKQISILRRDNPVSLMHRTDIEDDKAWLLVMTDIRGRSNRQYAVSDGYLKGVRVYQSVMGIPRERILNLERVLANRSVNIGPCLDVVCDAARAANQILYSPKSSLTVG